MSEVPLYIYQDEARARERREQHTGRLRGGGGLAFRSLRPDKGVRPLVQSLHGGREKW